ncbi:hypothetical protein [Candidatus Bandiella euplotis]|uniref:Uncharacterized protein n=1 Tax=Candidatus Bandiella euplotis TaxID=1664265 RepID=A0ABZ0UN02_9RICK|nr:hypothetical protein [Candidatus Bandiella woodruffii]WPX96073.1 hypothetical protein Bandiella_00176 [Candidatus Bandiella woodruffii]
MSRAILYLSLANTLKIIIEASEKAMNEHNNNKISFKFTLWEEQQKNNIGFTIDSNPGDECWFGPITADYHSKNGGASVNYGSIPLGGYECNNHNDEEIGGHYLAEIY